MMGWMLRMDCIWAFDIMCCPPPLEYEPKVGDLKLTKLGLLSRHSVAKLTQLLLQVSCGLLVCPQVGGLQ